MPPGKPLSTAKDFPLCGTGRKIPWSTAERAYEAYAKLYGRSQTLERLAERGGFYVEEMNKLYPEWREEVEEVYLLRTEVERLKCENSKLQTWVANDKEVFAVFGDYPDGPTLGQARAVKADLDRYKAALEQIADTDAAWSGIGCAMLASEALGVKESV